MQYNFSHPNTSHYSATPSNSCALSTHPCTSVPLGYDNAMTFGHVAVLCACWVGQHVQVCMSISWYNIYVEIMLCRPAAIYMVTSYAAELTATMHDPL